jgi:hypothetical protein
MELERYYSILQKANFPELISFIKLNLQNIRITHMFNHPTNFYFLEIFRLIIEKYFLGGPYFLPQYIFDATKEEFLQSKEYDTKLTFYDYHYLGFRIPENYMDEIDSRNYILGFQ